MSVVSKPVQAALGLLAKRHPQPVSGDDLIQAMQANSDEADEGDDASLKLCLRRMRKALGLGIIHPVELGPTWSLSTTQGARKMQEARWAITPHGRRELLRKAELDTLPGDTPGRWAQRATDQGAHLSDVLLLVLLERPTRPPRGAHLLRLAHNSDRSRDVNWAPTRSQRACLASLALHKFVQPAYSAEEIGPHDDLLITQQWWQLSPAGLQRAQAVQQALLHSQPLPPRLKLGADYKVRQAAKVRSAKPPAPLKPGSLAHHLLGQLQTGAPLSAPPHGPGAQPTASPQDLADTLADLCLAGYARERAATPGEAPGQPTHQLTPRGVACLATLDMAPTPPASKPPKLQAPPQPQATHFGEHRLPVVAGPRQPQLDAMQPPPRHTLSTPLRDRHCHRHAAASRRGDTLHYPDGSHCPAHDAAARAAIEQRLRQRVNPP